MHIELEETLMTIKALDHMIKNDLFEYSADPWCRSPIDEHFASMQGYAGQVDYNGEIFVVTRHSGHHGMGGMDQGSPESVSITRIQQTVAPEDKIKVELVEFEAGWGQRVDEVKEFDTLKQAKAFVDDFNKGNDEPVTPEWYMIARIVDKFPS